MSLTCWKFVHGFLYFRIKVQVFIITSKALNILTSVKAYVFWLPCCSLNRLGILPPQETLPPLHLLFLCLECSFLGYLHCSLSQSLQIIFTMSLYHLNNKTAPLLAHSSDSLLLYFSPWPQSSSHKMCLYLSLCFICCLSLNKNVNSVRAETLNLPLYPQYTELSLPHGKCLVSICWMNWMEQVDFILALKDSDLRAKLNRPCKLQLLFILCLIFKIGFAYRILISRLWLYI